MSKRITDMTKDELLAYMKASREIHQFNFDLPSWRRAAQLYQEAGQKFQEDCSGCVRRLAEWLNG